MRGAIFGEAAFLADLVYRPLADGDEFRIIKARGAGFRVQSFTEVSAEALARMIDRADCVLLADALAEPAGCRVVKDVRGALDRLPEEIRPRPVAHFE